MPAGTAAAADLRTSWSARNRLHRARRVLNRLTRGRVGLYSTAEHYSSGPTAKLLRYFQYDENAPLACSRCHWSGSGAEANLNLFDELASHASATRDLERLCVLVADGRLDGQVELECSWREPAAALDAILQRRIGGKAVLHID